MPKKSAFVVKELRKIERNKNVTTFEVFGELKRTQRTIRREIAYLSGSAGIMTSAKKRAKVFGTIKGHYDQLSENIDGHIKKLIEQTAKGAHNIAANEMQSQKVRGIVRYSPKRTERYLEMVSTDNAGSMAAVFTDKMSATAIGQLRQAWVSAFREGQIGGMTANQTQRILQDKWNDLAGNSNAFRFVDSAGKSWDNARYLQMLVRTNAQRVSRDSYIDTLVESGHKLAQVSYEGTVCSICAAWEGRIIQIAGESNKWPTYDDAVASGLFHPNCLHRLEYLDETLDADEIKIQSGIDKPGEDSDAEDIQKQKTEIDEKRYMAKGMTRSDAQRAVTRDAIENNILVGTFNESAAQAVRKLSDDQLNQLRESGIPKFQMVKKGESTGYHKGSSGGVVRVPRKATASDILDALGLDKEKEK